MASGGINSREERKAAAEVLATVEWAFRNTPMPTDNLTMSDPNLYLECGRIQSEFGGIKWIDLPAKTVRKNPTALNELTIAAFRYYLPAYIWWSLKSPSDLFFLTGSVFFGFTPPSETASLQRKENYQARMRSFDLDEVEAIQMYLLHLESFYRDEFIEGFSPDDVLTECPLFSTKSI